MGTRSRIVVAAFFLLAVVSCGGGTSPQVTSTPSTATAQDRDETSEPAEQSATDEVGTSSDAGASTDGSGRREAEIAIDGESTTYDLDDITYSTVEGVGDITFETCDPDFFGSGRFYAIGYAVDSDGELIVGDDGQPGMFTMDLPPDDWKAAERDEPTFEIKLGGLDIEIASPEEASGGTMSWSIDDTTASGTAVFVDFDNTYTVDFDVVCEGSPTVGGDDLPSDDGAGDDGGGSGGSPLAGAGVGSFTADGESFDNVEVYSCEPFAFGSAPDPNDLSLLGYLGGTSGLEVEISHGQGFDMSDGTQFDQINVNLFLSRQGDQGLEQFDGSATNDADGNWFMVNRDTGEQTGLDAPPFQIDGDRISGGLDGLTQSWPDEGAATVDVTFDYEIPTQVNEDC